MVLAYWWLRENIRGLLISLGLIVPLCGMLLLPAFRAPVAAVSKVYGEVVSFVTLPIDPSYAVGRGFRYRYSIRLAGTETVVLVSDDASAPHAMGSTVALERLERADGTVGYNFLS